MELRVFSKNGVLLRVTTHFICNGSIDERDKNGGNDGIKDHLSENNDDDNHDLDINDNSNIYNDVDSDNDNIHQNNDCIDSYTDHNYNDKHSHVIKINNRNKNIETNIISVLIIKNKSHNKTLSILSILLLNNLIKYSSIYDTMFLLKNENRMSLFNLNNIDKFDNDSSNNDDVHNNNEYMNYGDRNNGNNHHNYKNKIDYENIKKSNSCTSKNIVNFKNHLFNSCEEILLHIDEFNTDIYSNKNYDVKNDNQITDNENLNNKNNNAYHGKEINKTKNMKILGYNVDKYCLDSNLFSLKYIDNAVVTMVNRLNGHLCSLFCTYNKYPDIQSVNINDNSNDNRNYNGNGNNDNANGNYNNDDDNDDINDNKLNYGNNNTTKDDNDNSYFDVNDNDHIKCKMDHDDCNCNNDNNSSNTYKNQNSELIDFLIIKLNDFLDLKFVEQISVTSLMFEVVCVFCSLIVHNRIDGNCYSNDIYEKRDLDYINDIYTNNNGIKLEGNKADDNIHDHRYIKENNHIQRINNDINQKYETLLKIFEKLIFIQKKIEFFVINIPDYKGKLNLVYEILLCPNISEFFDSYDSTNNLENLINMNSTSNNSKNISPLRKNAYYKNLEKNEIALDDRHYDFISIESDVNKHHLESYILMSECIKEFIGFIYGIDELNLSLKMTLDYSETIRIDTNINMGSKNKKVDKNIVIPINDLNDNNKNNIQKNYIYIATSNKNKTKSDMNIDNTNVIDDNDLYSISVPHTSCDLDRQNSPYSILDYDSEDEDIYNMNYNKYDYENEDNKKCTRNCTDLNIDEKNDEENNEKSFLIEYNVLYEELLAMHV